MVVLFEKMRDKKGWFVVNKKKRVVFVLCYVRNEYFYIFVNILRMDQLEYVEGDDNWKEGR